MFGKRFLFLLALVIIFNGCTYYDQIQRKPQIPVEYGERLKHRKNGLKLIASFTTPLTNNDSVRVNNINLALLKISNKTVKPGQVLSFKSAMHKFRPGSGFNLVRWETNNQPEALPEGPEQVATTLYMAWMRAGMPAVEAHIDRQNHLWAPREGQILITEQLDLRLKNNKSFPAIIYGTIQNNGVMVGIYR